MDIADMLIEQYVNVLLETDPTTARFSLGEKSIAIKS